MVARTTLTATLWWRTCGTGSVMMTLKMGAIDQVIPVFQFAHEAHAGALRGF